MCKKTGQITVHLSADIEQAVKNLAFDCDLSASQWVNRLIEREVKSKARYAPVKMTAELWERLWNNRYRPPHAGLYHGLLHFNQQMAEV